MNSLPEVLIPALEMLADRTSIKVEDAPDELRIAHTMKLVDKVTKYGPLPAQPKRSRKPARDLQAGDVVLMYVRGFDKSFVVEDVALQSDGIHVRLTGCKPLTYSFNGEADVLDAPIREPDSWKEYVLTPDTKTALDLRRLTAKQQTDDPPIGKAIPALDVKSNDWLDQHETVTLEGVKSVASLKAMRNAKGTIKNFDGTFGIDKAGRAWRKTDSKDDHAVYYFRPSLRSSKKSSGNRTGN